ncbi:MAG: type II and III secretion system protein [Desulfocapsa sp.]|nr:type II and III secretion system protein [Desulfocapsa sp.]
MKRQKPMVQLSCLLVLLFFLASCSPQKVEQEIEQPETPVVPVEKVEKKNQLPVQYQKPSYMVNGGNTESLDDVVDDVAIKVGASIRSTQGPQPLWDILKRLAALKKMNVSWASDVDQNVLVDVDISADDDFYAAVENLLRQVDYYHDMEGSTIVVKYKETRQFHIAMPFTKQLFETATGGNVLGSNDASSNIEGTIRLDSRGNEFDIWLNIQDNMNAILDTWSTSATATTEQAPATNAEPGDASTAMVTRQVSSSGNRYTIDKPVGLITVHAPRPLLNRLEIYFDNLKRELYKQVSIEAKIIEVHLNDRSSIGLNWNQLMKNLSTSAAGVFTDTRSHTTINSDDSLRSGSSSESWSRSPDEPWEYDGGSLARTSAGAVSAATIITNGVSEGLGAVVSLASFTFDTFLNAVKEQGQTTILSNPKLSVLNGQPALITVGRNVTYIDSIESDVNNETGTVSYTVETERVLSGVGLALTANILDNKEIILNLVPVTSELDEEIEYRQIGGGEIGLPIISVREMSTTVKVKDGEMLVIGGLISSVDEDDGTFIPGTSGIPFFKYLFGYEEKIKRKRELIILLKPRII